MCAVGVFLLRAVGADDTSISDVLASGLRDLLLGHKCIAGMNGSLVNYYDGFFCIFWQYLSRKLITISLVTISTVNGGGTLGHIGIVVPESRYVALSNGTRRLWPLCFCHQEERSIRCVSILWSLRSSSSSHVLCPRTVQWNLSGSTMFLQLNPVRRTHC